MSPTIDPDRYRIQPERRIKLADHPTRDVPDGLTKEEAATRTTALLARATELQVLLWAGKEHAVLLVLQAMDTGGKDGTIKRLFGPINPQGVRIANFGAPSERELSHDYLWRVHAEAPARGEIGVFNRSHYEDVLVVRVHDLVPEARWRARYDHIRRFEQMLTDEGTTIVKVMLHIGRDEQRARLQARIDTPTKRWKFNPGDLTERALWDDYQTAYAEALSETATEHAPWYVVPADQKWYRDLVVAQLLVDTLESLDLRTPPDPEGIEGLIVE